VVRVERLVKYSVGDEMEYYKEERAMWQKE